MTLLFSIFFAYSILNGSSNYVSGAVGIVLGQFSAFYAFMMLSTTIILLKLKDKKANPRGYYAVALIGVIITGIFLLPLSLSPSTALVAEQNCSEAFGADWYEDIPDKIEEKYFLKTPFSTPKYFLGVAPKEVNILEHKKFYEDDEVDLYFDAYWVEGAEDLPGEASVMIRIHGGGWVFGDKGWGDMMQVAKYFAAQGYIVFDIQYRLDDMDGLLDSDPLTPAYRKGEFDIEDIVESIGFFNKYIVDKDFDNGLDDANFDKVFVSGGSAGGHLTCMLGLGIASGEYDDILGDEMTIAGILPFYPALGISTDLGIDGKKDFLDPSRLVDEDSPPCLIYQGTIDGLVHPSISQKLKDTYTEEDNDECAIVWILLNGHSNDIYFSGYGNQVYLYFAERFCYQVVQGEIK